MVHNNGSRVGWYGVLEDFNKDGSIDLVVIDKRDHDIIDLNIDTLEDHTRVFELLQKNQVLGSLPSIKAKFSK